MAISPKLWIGLALVAVVGSTLVWLNQPKPLPPLLQHVSAASGWWGACPPQLYTQKQLALSPQLNQRLATQFPPDTSQEEELISVLRTQGFGDLSSCKDDSSIYSMIFRASTIHAAVFWKANEGKLVWTKGFVAYKSL